MARSKRLGEERTNRPNGCRDSDGGADAETGMVVDARQHLAFAAAGSLTGTRATEYRATVDLQKAGKWAGATATAYR